MGTFGHYLWECPLWWAVCIKIFPNVHTLWFNHSATGISSKEKNRDMSKDEQECKEYLFIQYQKIETSKIKRMI